MDLKTLFPQGRWVKQVSEKETSFAFQMDSGYWLVDLSSMTVREQALVSTMRQQPQIPQSEHPWLTFLEGRGEQPKIEAKNVQFIHLHIRQTSLEDISPLLDMLQSFFQNYVTRFQMTRKDYILVLDQSQLVEVTDILLDTLAAMEFDFDSQLSFLVGTILSSKDIERWPVIFQTESRLFDQWNQQYNRSSCIGFSRLYLWSQKQDENFINYLKKRIREQEGLADIIFALWQESAVLTKAAQKLYIHRNTLQYRLEKFYESTGLSLKNMDDLALCYLTVISESF